MNNDYLTKQYRIRIYLLFRYCQKTIFYIILSFLYASEGNGHVFRIVLSALIN